MPDRIKLPFSDASELEAAIMGIKDNGKLREYLKTLGLTLMEQQKVLDEADAFREKTKLDMAAQSALIEDLKKGAASKYDTAKTPERLLYEMGLMYRAIAQGRVADAHKFGALNFGNGVDFINGWPSAKTVKDVRDKADLGTPLYSDAVTGSYLVRVDYIAEVLRIAAQASQMMGKVSRYPMSGITAYIPKAGTQPSFTWISAQSTAKTETNPTFDRMTLTAYTAALWLAYVDELEEDSIVPLGIYFRDTIAEAWGSEFDRCCLTKNSSGSDLWNGALHAGTGIYTMGAGATGFSSLDFDDLDGAIGQLDTQAKRQGATWIWHTTVFDYLRNLKDANGQYYLNPYGSQAPSTVKGFPHIECDIMPSSSDSAAATKFVVLCNPKYIVHGDRVGLALKRFDQTAYRVQYDEIFIQARVRAAFGVSQPAAVAVIKTAAS